MATFTESSLNRTIAKAIRSKVKSWDVTAERLGVFPEDPRKKPDILVTSSGRVPVILENEYDLPGSRLRVEQEAFDRLGFTLANGQPVQSVVALLSDPVFKCCHDEDEALGQLSLYRFQYALYQPGTNVHKPQLRYPDRGFISGKLDDLIWFVLHASRPVDALERSIQTLQIQIDGAIHVLESSIGRNEATLRRLSKVLRQKIGGKDGKTLSQAMGIAATVMVNAAVFQQRLAETLDVRNLDQMKAAGDLTQAGVLLEWERILDINYWPIFELAKRVLAEINSPSAALRLVQIIASTAVQLIQLGVVNSEDLSGVVYQRFMADRKFLATFYTRPETAAFLAHLAIPRWSDANRYRRFKIADFACGTGTLIHAAYQRLSFLQVLAGGNPKDDHQHMMEHGLTAADIVPSAAHLTASMLSSVYPSMPYRSTRVIIPAYGRLPGVTEAKHIDDVRLGSLELSDTTSERARIESLFPVRPPSLIIGGQGERSEAMFIAAPAFSQDVVIMNPPYTRAGSDWDYEGEHVKPYRGLSTRQREQKLMGQRQSKLFTGKGAFHGKAGLGTAFFDVAAQMVKKGGKVAFVLPMTCAVGDAWSNLRREVCGKFGEVMVVSIADAPDGKGARALSADTRMGEILLLARSGSSDRSITYVNLHQKLLSTISAYEVARSVVEIADDVPALTGSLTGGRRIAVGGDLVGSIIRGDLEGDTGWCAVGIRNLRLAQVAHQLSSGALRLPRNIRAEVPIARIETQATISLNDINIANGKSAPFERVPLSRNPEWPMLWANDKHTQKSLVVSPDSEGKLIDGREKKADAVWRVASYAHTNRNTRLTSQCLTAAFTKECSIGGTAMPNVCMGSREKEAAFVLWSNSTLGCIAHWYYGSKQQSGRARHSVSTIPSLPTIDTQRLDSTQLQMASDLIDQFAAKELREIQYLDQDEVRHALDHAVYIDLLGLPEHVLEGIELLRGIFCQEPTVTGISPNP
ncbi:MAG: hypothetical protein OXU68_06120 [Bacteroidota bacterium]|nr:hypothetical protein [Bacteroidota bacterium]